MLLENVSKNSALPYKCIFKSESHVPESVYMLCWINLLSYLVQTAGAPERIWSERKKDSLGD